MTQNIAKTVALTIHLEAAERSLLAGQFGSTMLALNNALKVANASGRNDIKRLIFRAMNHVRSCIKRARQ